MEALIKQSNCRVKIAAPQSRVPEMKMRFVQQLCAAALACRNDGVLRMVNGSSMVAGRTS